MCDRIAGAEQNIQICDTSTDQPLRRELPSKAVVVPRTAASALMPTLPEDARAELAAALVPILDVGLDVLDELPHRDGGQLKYLQCLRGLRREAIFRRIRGMARVAQLAANCHCQPATSSRAGPCNTCSDGTSSLFWHQPATLCNRLTVKQVYKESVAGFAGPRPRRHAAVDLYRMPID
jgi:hypothetical protein